MFTSTNVPLPKAHGIPEEPATEEETTIGKLTLGIMGGVSVPFRNPSQLKPSNHLKGGKNPKLDGYSTKRKENGLNNRLHLPQILPKNPFGIFPVIFFLGRGRKSVQQPRGDTTQVEMAHTQIGTIPCCRCPGSCSFPSKGGIPPPGTPKCPFSLWNWVSSPLRAQGCPTCGFPQVCPRREDKP